MHTITADEVKTMIHDIDVRLDRKSHYSMDCMPKGVVYHVGDHKYVTLDDFSSVFEEYEWDHKGVDYACYMYILAKNAPERIDFYTRAYNLGGLEVLSAVYNAVTEAGNEPVVYRIYGL